MRVAVRLALHCFSSHMRQSMPLGHLLFFLGLAVLLFRHTYLEYRCAANGMHYSPLFFEKPKLIICGPVRLAVDVAVLHLMVCLCAPKIRNAVTQSSSGNCHIVSDTCRFHPHCWNTSTCIAPIPEIMWMPELADCPARIYHAPVSKPLIMSSCGCSNHTQSPKSFYVGLDYGRHDTEHKAKY